MESEETQDYLKEARNVSHEEMEEKCCVPSAISVPQKHLFRCDTHCSEKAFSFWQFASVVKKEGRRSHTRQMYASKCYNESLVGKGDKQLTRWQWYELVEKKTHRGRFWKMMGKEQHIREMWEYFLRERSRVKKFREEAERERQAGIQGQ